MITPLNIATDGHIDCGDCFTLSVATVGHLTCEKEELIDKKNFGGGSSSSNRINIIPYNNKVNDKDIKNLLVREDNEILTLIKIFLKCQ